MYYLNFLGHVSYLFGCSSPDLRFLGTSHFLHLVLTLLTLFPRYSFRLF